MFGFSVLLDSKHSPNLFCSRCSHVFLKYDMNSPFFVSGVVLNEKFDFLGNIGFLVSIRWEHWYHSVINLLFSTFGKKVNKCISPKLFLSENHVSIFALVTFVDLVFPHSVQQPFPSFVASLDYQSFPLNLICSLCILTVLNFWQTSRNIWQSCPAAAAFSPPATLVSVWPSDPSPRHLTSLLRPRPRPRSGRSHAETETLWMGRSLDLTPPNLAVPPGAYWTLWPSPFPPPPPPPKRYMAWPLAGHLVTWVAEEEQDALFFSGSDNLSWKGLNWGAKCVTNHGNLFPYSYYLVFIYTWFTLLVIYLHIDLWQVSEIFINGMFFFCVCWSFFNMEIKTCFTAVDNLAHSLLYMASAQCNHNQNCKSSFWSSEQI